MAHFCQRAGAALSLVTTPPSGQHRSHNQQRREVFLFPLGPTSLQSTGKMVRAWRWPIKSIFFFLQKTPTGALYYINLVIYTNKPFVSNLICYCLNLQSTYSTTITLSLVVLVTVWMCTIVHVLFYSKIYYTNSKSFVRFNLLTRPSLFRSWRASTLMCRWSRRSWLWAYYLMTLSTVFHIQILM